MSPNMPDWKEVIRQEDNREEKVRAKLREEEENKRLQQSQRNHELQLIIQEHLRQVPEVMQRFQVREFLEAIRSSKWHGSNLIQTCSGYELRAYPTYEMVHGGSGWDVWEEKLWVTPRISIDYRWHSSSEKCLNISCDERHSSYHDPNDYQKTIFYGPGSDENYHCRFTGDPGPNRWYRDHAKDCTKFELVETRFRDILSGFATSNAYHSYNPIPKSKHVPWYKKIF